MPTYVCQYVKTHRHTHVYIHIHTYAYIHTQSMSCSPMKNQLTNIYTVTLDQASQRVPVAFCRKADKIPTTLTHIQNFPLAANPSSVGDSLKSRPQQTKNIKHFSPGSWETVCQTQETGKQADNKVPIAHRCRP